MVKIGIDKGQATVAALLIAVLPWLGGGRDPAGLVMIYGAAVIGLFLVWRLDYKVAAKPALAIPAALLGLWALTSLVWSVNRYETLVWAIGLGLTFALFNLAYQLGRKVRLFEAWVNGYLAIAASVSLYGFGLYLTGGPDRLTSIFGAADVLAGFLLPAIIVGWWRFGRRGGWFYGVASVLNLAAFILANSSAAIIILALLSFVSLSLISQRIGQWTKIVFVLTIGLGVALGLNLARANLAKNPATVAVKSTSASASGQIQRLRSTVAIWSDHPLVGTGAGTFASVYPQYQYGLTGAATDAGDLYLQVTGELGIVGAILLVWLLVELGRGLWRGGRAEPELVPMVVGLVALLIHFGASSDALYPVLWVLTAILAGFSYRPGEPTKPSNRSRLLMTTATLILVTAPLVSNYRSRVLAAHGQINQANDDYAAAASDFHSAGRQLIYDPLVVTAEGTDDLTLATQGHNAATNLVRATRLAELATRLDQSDAAPYFLLGQADYARGQDGAAETAFRRALVLDPYNHPEYYTGLAELYLREDKVTAAFDLSGQAISLYPTVVIKQSADPTLPAKLAQAYAIQATALIKLGQITEGRAAIAQSLGLDPTNGTAQQLLSQIGE